MLTRVVLRRGATLSVRRLFATSVPRWNVPTSAKGTATEPLDADAIKAQHKTAQQAIEKAQQKSSKEWIAYLRTVLLCSVGFLLFLQQFLRFFFGFSIF